MTKFDHCGRGICSAQAGHAGTCAQASGWVDERYTATFDSLHPEHGIVVDEQAERYARFVTLAGAESAAEKLNDDTLGTALAAVLVWRSTATGKLLEMAVGE